MTANRARARFVPTLTEVVHPNGSAPKASGADQAIHQSPSVGTSPSRSMLDAAVDDLMPQARAQMRERLHNAAYELAEAQLRSMEESLRHQLRNALREAAGMGKRN